MKRNFILSKLLVSLVLIAAMALVCVSCGETAKKADTTSAMTEPALSTEATTASGEGEDRYTITVEVVNDKGEHKDFTLSTDAENLGDALKESGFVEGNDDEYGFYITVVDGLLADYNTNGAYWCLYKDGEMLTVGASETQIADGEHYEIVYTK